MSDSEQNIKNHSGVGWLKPEEARGMKIYFCGYCHQKNHFVPVPKGRKGLPVKCPCCEGTLIN